MRFDVPRILQDSEQERGKATSVTFPCFDVSVARFLRFLLGLIARQTRALAHVHLSAQSVNNVLARIQQRIEEELSRVRVLSLMELAEEKGTLLDLPLCFLEHGLISELRSFEHAKEHPKDFVKEPTRLSCTVWDLRH